MQMDGFNKKRECLHLLFKDKPCSPVSEWRGRGLGQAGEGARPAKGLISRGSCGMRLVWGLPAVGVGPEMEAEGLDLGN